MSKCKKDWYYLLIFIVIWVDGCIGKLVWIKVRFVEGKKEKKKKIIMVFRESRSFIKKNYVLLFWGRIL